MCTIVHDINCLCHLRATFSFHAHFNLLSWLLPLYQNMYFTKNQNPEKKYQSRCEYISMSIGTLKDTAIERHRWLIIIPLVAFAVEHLNIST